MNVVQNMVVMALGEEQPAGQAPVVDLRHIPEEVRSDGAGESDDGSPTSTSSLAGTPLEQIEKRAIRETLRLTNGNREHAAKLLGIGERTLYRKIHQALGVTPYELMLRIRIESAAEALIQTNDKVIEIAQAHAFCDQSAFTQHFRKRIGLTPKQFRMRHQG
jgi:transcriptional regulator GlxA family with amidase domain